LKILNCFLKDGKEFAANYKQNIEGEIVTSINQNDDKVIACFVKGKMIFLSAILFLLISGVIYSQTSITPVLTLQDPGAGDQDDMCIWIHSNTSLSTIIGSDKVAYKLFVYDLSGITIQTISVPGKPGNIDVRYNFPLSGELVDIVGYNDRDNSKIVLFKIDQTNRTLIQVANFDAGNWPHEIYGFCLYRSPNNGKYYAIASGTSSQIRQWELVDAGNGTIVGIEKRTWVNDNGSGDLTEGLVADDETAKLYAANEGEGIYEYDADPDIPNPVGQLIAPTGSNGLTQDVEGIAIYYAANGQGYLLASSQGSDDFKVYERQEPHNFVKTFSAHSTKTTDGIDVTNVSLGSAFPQGIFTAHNGSAAIQLCNFADLGLDVDTSYWNPRNNTSTGSIDQGSNLPKEFRLNQNFPNPFNPNTSISYSLPRSARVQLMIYDVRGRKVVKVLDGFYAAGFHIYDWHAVDPSGAALPSGIYFARMELSFSGISREDNAFTKTIKMVLSR
jgi:3-phytase